MTEALINVNFGPERKGGRAPEALPPRSNTARPFYHPRACVREKNMCPTQPSPAAAGRGKLWDFRQTLRAVTVQLPLEMLGIVLFRFRPLARVWVIALIAVNLGSLAFIQTQYGLANLLATLAGIGVMILIYARLGFVRLLGVGHIFWIPMLIWFACSLPDKQTEPLLYYWVLSLIAFNSVSLLIDAIDVIRFAAGERSPHYVWREADDPPRLR